MKNLVQFTNKEKNYLYEQSSKFVRYTTAVEFPYREDFPVNWSGFNSYFGYVLQQLD